MLLTLLSLSEIYSNILNAIFYFYVIKFIYDIHLSKIKILYYLLNPS